MQTLGSGHDPTVNKSVDVPIVTSIYDELIHRVSEDIGTLEELDEGLYLKSGDPIRIRDPFCRPIPPT